MLSQLAGIKAQLSVGIKGISPLVQLSIGIDLIKIAMALAGCGSDHTEIRADGNHGILGPA